MPKLSWKREGSCLYAYLGEISIGRVQDLDERGFGWVINGVTTKFYTKGVGNMPGYFGPKYETEAAARRALVRSWRRWCQLAGLLRDSSPDLTVPKKGTLIS